MTHHDLPPRNLDLKNALHEEKHLLEHAKVPIVTVSATFRKELIKKYRSLTRSTSEAIFSRAHFSMAEALRVQATNQHLTTHMVDPTNFVSHEDWSKIDLTELIGQQMARHKFLKLVKDKIDTVARSKLPITDAITPPLLYLTENVSKPIISLHYEAGNIIAKNGHRIIQVLTDPHVRPQYLDPLTPIGARKSIKHAPIHFAVFDKKTKVDLQEAALALGKNLNSKQVVITGPPVDPRITKLAKKPKNPHKNRPLNIAITTGGLGTNLQEIKHILDEFAPFLTPPEHIRLFLYAGTHRDFRNTFEDFAATHNLRVGNLDDSQARVRILYEDSIIDANDNLIEFMFPWADAIITKPSGDMAYDSVAAGCVPLFLEPWGDWEKNIQERLTKLGAGIDFKVAKAHNHLSYLMTTGALAKARRKALRLPPLYRKGCHNILALHKSISKKRPHSNS